MRGRWDKAGVGTLRVFPKVLGKGFVDKALQELPRLMGSPQVVTMASSISLCLSVPRHPYPSPWGRAWLRPKTQCKPSAEPWSSDPILRSCHTVPQPVGSHRHVFASRSKNSPRSISPGPAYTTERWGRMICPRARGTL